MAFVLGWIWDSNNMTEPKKENDKTIWQRFKSNFKPTEISNQEETMFDLCMKCGRRLPDRKLSTLKEHQDKAHPLTKKDKRTAFVFKHMSIVLIGMVFLLTSIIWFASEIVFEESLPPVINVEVCVDRTIALKSLLYETKEFRSEHVAELNYLMNECNASFWSYKYGTTIFESDYYSFDKVAERQHIGTEESIYDFVFSGLK